MPVVLNEHVPLRQECLSHSAVGTPLGVAGLCAGRESHGDPKSVPRHSSLHSAIPAHRYANDGRRPPTSVRGHTQAGEPVSLGTNSGICRRPRLLIRAPLTRGASCVDTRTSKARCTRWAASRTIKQGWWVEDRNVAIVWRNGHRRWRRIRRGRGRRSLGTWNSLPPRSWLSTRPRSRKATSRQERPKRWGRFNERTAHHR
jgi:hypothetical protein